MLFDVLEADEGTQVLATYGTQYYAGTPAFTFRPSAGNGGVYYAATFPDETAMPLFVDRILDGTGIAGLTAEPLTGTPVDSVADIAAPADGTPVTIEVTRRVADDGTTFTFVLNPAYATVSVDLPQELAGHDLLADADIAAGPLTLAPYAVLVLETA